MFFHCLFQRNSRRGARPLSECCGCSRVKVCRISGDRSVCGRMASLGVLEPLCPGTLSLDELTAASILSNQPDLPHSLVFSKSSRHIRHRAEKST
jgi:hypothetical protein